VAPRKDDEQQGSGFNYETMSYNAVTSPQNLMARNPEFNPAPQPNYERYAQIRGLVNASTNRRFTADRMEREMQQYASAVRVGLLQPTGALKQALVDATPFTDLLTPEEREFFGSGGDEGNYSDMLLSDSTVRMPYGRTFDNVQSPLEDDQSKAVWLALNAPGAYKAIVDSGADPRDIATVKNVYVARAAADAAKAYWEQGLLGSAEQIIAALPADQQVMAIAFLDQYSREATQAAEAARQQAMVEPDTTTATGTDVVASRGIQGRVGDMTAEQRIENAREAQGINPLTMLVDALLVGVETTTQVARMAQMAQTAFRSGQIDAASIQGQITRYGEQSLTAESSVPERIAAVWNAVSPGFVSQTDADELISQYGQKNFDTMYAYYMATQSEDETAMVKFFASIDGDPEAMALVTSALRGENVGGDENNGAELFVQIAGRDQGNYGNLVASSVGMTPDTLQFGLTRDAVNVSSWFVLDPLLIAGAAGKAARLAKFGMAGKLSKHGGSIARAIREDEAVARVYDRFGESVARIKAETNPAARDELLAIHNRQFTSRESRFFAPEHTEIALERGLVTAEDWAKFYQTMDDVERVLTGKPITIDPSKRGMDYLSQFTPEARREAERANAMRVGEAYAPVAAWNAQIAVQTGNRALYVPHMGHARAVVQSMFRNQTLNATSAQLSATRILEQQLGEGWASRPRDEQIDVLARALQDKDTAEALGAAFSDLQAVSEGGRRTWVARNILDPMLGGPGSDRRLAKWTGWARTEKDEAGNVRQVWTKGWARKRAWNKGATFTESFTRMRDQYRRLLTVIPDARNGIITDTARDADKVYQMAVASGMGKSAANMLRSFWTEANEGQRQLALTGLVRTFLRASGVNVVDEQAERELLALMSGVREGEAYAASHIARYGGAMRDIAKAAQDEHARLLREAADMDNPYTFAIESAQTQLDELIAQGGDFAAARAKLKDLQARAAKWDREQRPKPPSVEQIRKDMVRQARKPGGVLAQRVSPDVTTAGIRGGLYPDQMSPRMYIPNFQVLDRYMARTSLLNALLFNNRVGSTVTNLWVLGTLAGPRFQFRNGLEDVGLYALTGGKVKPFLRGRRMDQTVLEATARDSKDLVAKQVAFKKAQRETVAVERRVRASKAEQSELDKARRDEEAAQKSLDQALKLYGRHGKLGVFRTMAVDLSEKATYVSGTDRVRDGVLARVAQFLVPTTSSFERRAAALAGREAVVDLAAQALMRQKLVRSGDKRLRAFGRRLARAKSMDELTPEDRVILAYEKQLLNSEYGYAFKEEAAESSRHLSDSTLPAVGDEGTYTYLDGELYRAVYLDREYATRMGLSSKTLSDREARAMMAHLQFMTAKYSLNQRALNYLPRYWEALNAPGGTNQEALQKIITEVVNRSKVSKDWAYVRQRMRLNSAEREQDVVRRMMDDMAATFTGRDGDWNQELYGALRRTDDKGRPYFEIGDGDEQRIFVEDFMQGKYDHPESILVYQSEPVWVPANDGREFGTTAWEMMGRSLARLTRNPLFYGNYLETRKALAPLEARYAKVFGEERAARMMTDLAAERAYGLTMSYVDNPAIRTNLAWQVRNIARYYRAQEDFGRRLIRTGKYEPMAYWKAVLAWQASQDFGFVHKDQYGGEYFIYPMSAPVMAAVQQISSAVGFGSMKYAAAPMAFGGKVQWLSPSLDPNQWMPTASSPWTAVTLQPILRTMPVAQDFFKAIEAQVFGDIAAQQDIDSPFSGYGENLVGAVYGALPPVVKKMQAVITSAIGEDAPGTFGYKMTMRTIASMAAAGQVPTPEEWADEQVRNEFMDTMQARTVEMSLLSLIFGFFAPSSPQYMDDYASLAAREAGYQALRPAFRDMVEASLAGGSDWNDAYIRWTESNPTDGVFLQSQSEGYDNGYVAPTLKNVEYLKSNLDVWEEAPRGMSLFMPEGKDAPTTNAAFQALKTYNATKWKEVESYAGDMIKADGYWQWLDVQNEFDRNTSGIPEYMPDGSKNPVWTEQEEIRTLGRSLIRNEYRGIDYLLNSDGWTQASEYRVVAREIVEAATSLSARGNAAANVSLPLIDAYLSFKSEYEDVATGRAEGVNMDDAKSALRETWEIAVNLWLDDVGDSLTLDQKRGLVVTFTKAIPDSGAWEPVEVR
jgi:hypothetical protein